MPSILGSATTIIVTDFPSMTNVREIWLEVAAKLLLEWGVNEALDPQVIAGAGCAAQVVARLAKRYCRAEVAEAAASESLVERFEVDVSTKVKVDDKTCLYLRLLGAQYSYLLVLNKYQKETLPIHLSRLFSASRRIVIDALTPEQADYRRALTNALRTAKIFPDQCIGIFASREALQAAASLYMDMDGPIAHVNGQGPKVEAEFGLAGARAIARSWPEAIMHIARSHDLPASLISRLPPPNLEKPEYPPEYLSCFRGPPSDYDSHSAGPGVYFTVKGPKNVPVCVYKKHVPDRDSVA